ncbi:ribonuclease HIII [Streptococcus loxodontisalivarius]|uniref:Ribonuclease HIII n=1 Tax=Streptococcus loxodontisalivarius TaxID=1349415 RepID=A0ABS2PRQ4_9STRE|nr:ribonuclease HIII [Streptococcus loxodontisalivarius]MBM7642714.1 ribonuclease HIII [Streptococcus loxodontisalivarius]
MNTYVVKLSGDDMKALVSQLTPQQISNNNPYVSFAAKVDGVTVLAYTSGKVVFQGNQAEQVASKLGFASDLSSNQKTANSPAGQNMALIGTDEVGNGSYFGGLAVVASLVRPEDHAFLKSLGVDDSKNLNDIKIRQIAPILKEKIKHQALLLSPKKYNEVVGDNKPYNAVSVKVALHNQAIFLLLKAGAKADKIVIDAFTSPKNYDKYVKQEVNQVDKPITLEEKAEGKYLAVAVSSIIARDLFLENLDMLSDECGYRLPSGAGAKSDQVASKILATYGMAGLNGLAKLHFANTQKAQKLLSK